MTGDDAAVADGGHVTVDAMGLVCPLPIIELAKAARGREAGTEITVLCTDVAARVDVPAWARMTGHEFVGEMKTDGAGIALTVRLR
ncbi:sulfurtransferase TusA family protein [Demequina silvatica]|uniref:sulfurtransferase TusA family protein n=1 Tax=Demequina silvatica TaxID=1638988 RepID=UPI000A90B257|nr:sulfurtransferase TusA family protein [Demequina silvatica]